MEVWFNVFRVEGNNLRDLFGIDKFFRGVIELGYG